MRYHQYIFIIWLTVSIQGNTAYAQLPDTVQKSLVGDTISPKAESLSVKKTEKKEKDPRRASLLSAVLPGAGQAYNGKYWKIPILYGGIYTLGHFIKLNHTYYTDFRQAYIIRMNGGTDDYAKVLPNADQLIRLREYYRRNRDLLIIVSAFTYLLNIADAAVDAHLSGFSVADDLELTITPLSLPGTSQLAYSTGIRFRF